MSGDPASTVELEPILRRRCPGLLERTVPVAEGPTRIRTCSDGTPTGQRVIAEVRARLDHTETLVADDAADVLLAVIGTTPGRYLVDTVADWAGPAVVVVTGGPDADQPHSPVEQAIAALRRTSTGLGSAPGVVTLIDLATSDSVDPVVSALRAAAGDRVTRRQHVLRALASERIAADLEREHARLRRLAAERSAVVARRHAVAAGAEETRRHLQAVRVHLVATLGSSARALDLDVRELARFRRGRLDPACWRAVEQRIGAATADAAARFGAIVAERIPDAVEPGVAPVELVAPRLPGPSGADEPPSAPEAPQLPALPGPIAVDRAAPLIGAAVGVGLGRAAAATLGLAHAHPVTILAMVLGAVGMAVVTLSARRRPLERARFERWCAAAVAEVRAGWERQLLETVLSLETRALGHSDRLRRGRLDTADALLGRIDDHLRRGRAEAAALERDLAAVGGRDGTATGARAS
ncbi:hypothetical protein [Millisia brevis]|uniref:hypothetical protein n=1 Tax=Millisia brevis TaxID=264148 RepID=UPI000830CA33|nr:hypothetical protein [Millisia brevis]